MKSEARGESTLDVEVTHISQHEYWLLLGHKKLFLPFSEFPWFKGAPLSAILNLQLLHADHLYWPGLDVDLAVQSIEQPDNFFLVSKPEA